MSGHNEHKKQKEVERERKRDLGSSDARTREDARTQERVSENSWAQNTD